MHVRAPTAPAGAILLGPVVAQHPARSFSTDKFYRLEKIIYEIYERKISPI